MSNNPNNTLDGQIRRVLEIPEEWAKVAKRLTALRAERRTHERKIKAREALIKSELLEDEEYQAASNKEARDAIYQATLYSDPDWEGLQERLEGLSAAIDRATDDKEALDHERKALKAALEARYAQIYETKHDEKLLAETVSRNRGALA